MTPYFRKPEGELLATKAIRRLAGMLYDRKPKKTRVATPSPKQADTFDKIYDSFVAAETSSRGFDHLRDSDQGYWRRTVAAPTGGSTAYGPVQMTKTLYQDMIDNQDRYGLEPNDILHLALLLKQGKDFAKHGKNKGKIPDYRSNYDYSGRGLLDEEGFERHEKDFKSNYKKLAIKAMKEHFNRAGSVEGMVELWRGKKPEEDPDYYQRFYSSYNAKSSTK